MREILKSKKILIIMIVLFNTSHYAFSQLQHFLPDTNAYFSVSDMKFWFSGDTIIKNLQYKKVYLQSGDSIGDFKKASYYASVREDTINEKIYSIKKNDGIERLIANFAVNTGDIVYVYSYYTSQEDTLLVTSVDEILINNENYKRF